MGRVRSLDRLNARGYSVKGKILSPSKNSSGYFTLVLSLDNQRQSVLLHCVIAQTWVENPDPETFTQVNHLKDDGLHLDNRASNFVWETPKGNSMHAFSLLHNEHRMRKVTLTAMDRFYCSIA